MHRDGCFNNKKKERGKTTRVRKLSFYKFILKFQKIYMHFFQAPPKGPNQPYDPLYWDEFMVPDYGGYSASEGGRGKGGPRGAPPGGRMGGGPMGMRGGVGGGGRYRQPLNNVKHQN